MNNYAAPLLLVFVLFRLASSFNCYIDTKGIPEPTEADVVDKSKFKTFQCNVLKAEKEKVKFSGVRSFRRLAVSPKQVT